MLIVTYRDDELGTDHPLHRVLGALPKGVVHRLRPQPLPEAAVAELARRAGRPSAGLRALTGGNPLLATEVLAAGDTGVPPTVRDLVLARLAGLPAGARELVRLVAVVPTRAELWLLEEAARPAPSAVEAGVSAGLLVAGDEAAGFRQELLRQAVEGSLSALARRELNRRVLAVLAGAPDREVDVARLVHHAPEAGDTEAVLRHAPEAARQAAAVAAHREAVGHYRAVLPHAERLPAAVRADLLEAYSVECYLSGLSPEAVSARRPPWACGRPPGTGRRSGRACAGCRACTGGTATGGRPRRPPPGPSPCWRPCRPATSSPWPTATRPSSTCWPTARRRRWLGRAGHRAGPAAG
jgi:hypothetical protein